MLFVSNPAFMAASNRTAPHGARKHGRTDGPKRLHRRNATDERASEQRSPAGRSGMCRLASAMLPSSPGSGSSMLHTYNASMERSPRAMWMARNLTRLSVIAAKCGPDTWTPPSTAANATNLLTCADYAERKPGWQSVRLVMGVATGPSNRKRRDAIRQTWMRWPSVGRTVVVCFAVGRKQVPPTVLSHLDDEAAAHGDPLHTGRRLLHRVDLATARVDATAVDRLPHLHRALQILELCHKPLVLGAPLTHALTQLGDQALDLVSLVICLIEDALTHLGPLSS